jgi:hypothetical protein
MVPDKAPASRAKFGLVAAERSSIDFASRANAQLRIESLTKGPIRAPDDWIATMAKVSSNER